MSNSLTKEKAWEILTEFNKDEFHLKHARSMKGVMRYFAEKLGYGDEQDFWGIAGLLHDLDFELYPDEHCIKGQEIMRSRGLDERLIRAVASHGYAITVDIEPEHQMEKILYATDELTGLIGAIAIMRPSKSVMDLKLKSVTALLNLTDPDTVTEIHREYVLAGADVITANTFQAHELKLHGEHSIEKVVTARATCAKKSGARFVALGVGPLGQLLELMGRLSFDRAYEVFCRQMVAGEQAGADLILIETISDLYEAKAAILAAKENPRLPVFCTMTFPEDGRTLRTRTHRVMWKSTQKKLQRPRRLPESAYPLPKASNRAVKTSWRTP